MQYADDEVIWQSLTENTKDRTRAAWDCIFLWLKERVLKAINSFDFDIQAKEDIIMHVAEGLMKIELRSLPALKNWISRVSKNKALDIQRERDRHVWIFEAVQSGKLEDPSDRDTSCAQVSIRDRTEVLTRLEKRAAVELGPEQKMFFELIRKYEYPRRGSVPKIAAELGIKENAAHQRIFRLMQKLRKWGESIQ